MVKASVEPIIKAKTNIFVTKIIFKSILRVSSLNIDEVLILKHFLSVKKKVDKSKVIRY